MSLSNLIGDLPACTKAFRTFLKANNVFITIIAPNKTTTNWIVGSTYVENSQKPVKSFTLILFENNAQIIGTKEVVHIVTCTREDIFSKASVDHFLEALKYHTKLNAHHHNVYAESKNVIARETKTQPRFS